MEDFKDELKDEVGADLADAICKYTLDLSVGNKPAEIDLEKKEALEVKQDKLYADALDALKGAIPDLLADMLTGANDLVKDEGIDYELDLSDLKDELRKYLINLKKESMDRIMNEVRERQEALEKLAKIPSLIDSIVNQKKEIA